MLKIHETVIGGGEGELVETFLRVDDGGELAVVTRGEAAPLPEGALDAVMARFGAPVEPGEKLATVASLELGAGRTLRHVRHLARFDVIARDYLVLEGPGREALCAMATTVTGALEHLARAARSA